MNAIPIHAQNPGPMTGKGNWTWLLPGRVPTLVDAGTGLPGHLDALEQALDGARLAQVLVTHAHPDHMSGVPALVERFPDARVRKMPWPDRDGRWRPAIEPIEDGQDVAAGDDVLRAVHTPGHAPDHLCFWHADSRTLFCGDLAIKGATVYVPASPGGDLVAYLASLDRVLALDPARLLPAHGPVIDEPGRVLRAYVEHRREREAQILEVLGEGGCTPEHLVRRVYRGLAPAAVKVARETVVAHLEKLEREGRVRRDAGAWHIMRP
jgi:glyoxylase-like metal-dependent hydrolase (beta-lactamase superfamily II)